MFGGYFGGCDGPPVGGPSAEEKDVMVRRGVRKGGRGVRCCNRAERSRAERAVVRGQVRREPRWSERTAERY